MILVCLTARNTFPVFLKIVSTPSLCKCVFNYDLIKLLCVCTVVLIKRSQKMIQQSKHYCCLHKLSLLISNNAKNQPATSVVVKNIELQFTNWCSQNLSLKTYFTKIFIQKGVLSCPQIDLPGTCRDVYVDYNMSNINFKTGSVIK